MTESAGVVNKDLAFASGSMVELTNGSLADIDGVGAVLRW